MDKCFKCIKDVINMGKIPTKVRFMLLDVIELRGNSWVPRRVNQDLQLKTIERPGLTKKKDLTTDLV